MPATNPRPYRTARRHPAPGGRTFPGPLALIATLACAGILLAVFPLVHPASDGGPRTEAATAGAEKDSDGRASEEEGSPAPLDIDLLGSAIAPVSTPRREWRAGTMPHLYQTDPLWSELPYAGGTVRENACGPTALCMVYIDLTGNTDLDPGSMASFADAGGFAPTGATEWSFMTQGASQLGLSSRAIPPSRAEVTRALDAGQPVICSVHAGDFTDLGHFIVLESIDGRGMVRVFDPNSAITSARPWGIQRVLAQAENCWTFWV